MAAPRRGVGKRVVIAQRSQGKARTDRDGTHLPAERLDSAFSASFGYSAKYGGALAK